MQNYAAHPEVSGIRYQGSGRGLSGRTAMSCGRISYGSCKVHRRDNSTRAIAYKLGTTRRLPAESVGSGAASQAWYRDSVADQATASCLIYMQLPYFARLLVLTSNTYAKLGRWNARSLIVGVTMTNYRAELNYVGQTPDGYLIRRHERSPVSPRHRFAGSFVPDLA